MDAELAGKTKPVRAASFASGAIASSRSMMTASASDAAAFVKCPGLSAGTKSGVMQGGFIIAI
jgi:hypothetical protein